MNDLVDIPGIQTKGPPEESSKTHVLEGLLEEDWPDEVSETKGAGFSALVSRWERVVVGLMAGATGIILTWLCLISIVFAIFAIPERLSETLVEGIALELEGLPALLNLLQSLGWLLLATLGFAFALFLLALVARFMNTVAYRLLLNRPSPIGTGLLPPTVWRITGWVFCFSALICIPIALSTLDWEMALGVVPTYVLSRVAFKKAQV